MKEKIIDYKRFGTTLLIFSVFLFLGSVLPKEDMTEALREGLILFTACLLALSALFFIKASHYQRKIEDQDQSF